MTVAAALVAGLTLVWQSTLVWPGTVAAVDGATPSPWIGESQTAAPDPAPTPEPTAALPTPTPAGAPPIADPTAAPTPAPNPEPSLAPTYDGPLTVAQYDFARVAGADSAPVYLDPNVPLLDEPRFEGFRLRLVVVNSAQDGASLTPLLEFASVPDGVFAAVPEGIPSDVPFRAANEWIALPRGGTKIGPTLVTDPPDSSTPDTVLSMGVNPMPQISIPADGRVVLEFSISATADATYEAEYAFRLTDAGTPLNAAGVPIVGMEAQPPLELTPGQRNGAPADSSKPRGGPRFNLTASSTTVHTASYDLSGEFCAACHGAHTALGVGLIVEPTQLSLCASCHNGTDLPSIVAEYSGIPANDAASRSYYQHDPALEQGTLGTANACADCHNPHDITSDPGAETAAGWTPSGRTYGATDSSGQRIGLEYQLCFKCHASPATLPSNSGQPPTRYALDKSVDFDPSNASYHPIEAAGTNATAAMAGSLAGSSPYKLWAANFTPSSTIRCVNCHADARLANAAYAANTYLPANSTLQVHGSPQRSILIQPYQDRTLNPASEGYQAADFALCYTCHSEAPFVDESGDVRGPPDSPLDSNFRYHGFHLSDNLSGHGTSVLGLDINTAEAGVGPAICSECHFRIHSTAYAVDVNGADAGDQTSSSRLVNFAPNVTALFDGSFSWQPRTYDGNGNLVSLGSCTLTCHGQPHNNVQY
jgi:predicted CXXCH cytochrome family protein